MPASKGSPKVGPMSAPRIAGDEELEAADAAALVDDAAISRSIGRGDLSFGKADSVEVSASRLAGVRLTGSELVRLRLVDVVLEDCDLSGVVLEELALTRVELRRSRLSGADLNGARLKDVRFVDCKLDATNLRMAAGERVAFDSCVMGEVDLYAAKMPAATFFDCDLTRAQFAKGDFRSARFHGSTLEGARGADSLKGAVIGPDQLIALALCTFAALGIAIDDDRLPEQQQQQQ